jgi:antitoxin component of RelBE/YafQ-DinJ toxin-antitoxin module
MEKRTQNKTTKLSIRLDENIRNKYHNYCNDNGYSLSKRLRLLIEKDIEGKLKIND